MNRYGRAGSRVGASAAPSKATPNTLCQKCLKKGHYSYECKEPRTERPYVSRPSRTQQLLNPKLLPKLMSDEPTDLLRKKGIADEELAKKEAERGRIRDRDVELEDTYNGGMNRKRERSQSIVSSTSTRSISSYSTNSYSKSPPIHHKRQSKPISRNDYHNSASMGSDRKRRRAESLSDEEEDGGQQRNSVDLERHTRRRFSDASPEQRGRRRSVEPSRERSARQASRSPVRGGSERYRRTEEEDEHQREINASQHTRTTDRRYEKKYSNSPAARVARDDRGRRLSNDDERYGATYRSDDDPRRSASPAPSRLPQPPRERSLSPFSKRMELTRSMAGGR